MSAEVLNKLKDNLCRHGTHVGKVTVVHANTDGEVAIPVCSNPTCRARASLYLKLAYGVEPEYKSFKEYGRST